MISKLKKAITKVSRRLGREKEHAERAPNISHYIDIPDEQQRLIDQIVSRQLSMCTYNNLASTVFACRYALQRNIAGAFVECGVWRGGNSILAASVFREAEPPRSVFLFDTFAGMNEPTEHDTRASDGSSALPKYEATKSETHSDWCFASLDAVRSNFGECGVGLQRVHCVQGPVESTLAEEAVLQAIENERIAVLRLDTDWYESTRVELEVLWPLLRPGGICIIDDYGYWSGARKAVDEFFAKDTPFLHPIDNSARLIIKS
jgi:O-methyltransferase